MDRIKKQSLFRIMSSILITSFIALDISWAYPVDYGARPSTLAAQSAFQKRQLDFIKDVNLLNTTYITAKYLLGSESESPKPFQNLCYFLENYLGKDATSDIDIQNITFKQGIVSIPYKRGKQKLEIQAAIAGTDAAKSLKGVEVVKSGAYVFKVKVSDSDILPDSTGPPSAAADKFSEQEKSLNVYFVSPEKYAVVCLEKDIPVVAGINNMRTIADITTGNYRILTLQSADRKIGTVYVICPLFKADEIWRDKFWNQRAELFKYFNGICDMPLLHIAIQACILVNGESAGFEEFEYASLKQAQVQFEKIMHEYENGLKYEPDKNSVDADNYSHIKLFGWIYYLEGGVISRVAEENKGQTSVLELGSSMGDPLFSKNKLLRGKNIRYLGVDKVSHLINVSLRYARENNLNNIEFAQMDLTDADWQNKLIARNNGQPFDVVTSSHLLEHLDGDPLEAILGWIGLAKHALIISVPLSKETIKISAHRNSFTVENLESLAQVVRERTGNNVQVDCGQARAGILVITKNNIAVETNQLSERISQYKNVVEKEGEMSPVAVKTRFLVTENIVYGYMGNRSESEKISEETVKWATNGLKPRIGTAIARELLIQPMASSWWLIRNLNVKYGIDVSVPELISYYEVIQKNKLIQDLLRYNSSGSKVLTVARGVLMKKKATTYYFDVQTTDVCPSKCRKCWRYYVDENGCPRLMPRHAVPSARKPKTEDFRRAFHQAIDLGVESVTSTGGGEPFMNKDIPGLLEDAKNYARTQGRNLRVFVPSCGLGVVYKDDALLKKAILNIDLLRFSFDSFDKEFVVREHGVTEKQYETMIENLKKCTRMRDELRRTGQKVNIDIEVLILLYGDNYKYVEQTVETARQYGATRILFNSITGNDDVSMTPEEQKASAAAMRRVYERASSGEFGGLRIDFDPVLLGGYSNLPAVDTANMERPLGNIRYCMKNVFGLTPVITADGTFHVCFPCSQTNIANTTNIFKIGNIMDSSLPDIVSKMRAEYRAINPEEDCIHDCRDIPYFNGIIRKVLDDESLGIPAISQPFLDRMTTEAASGHSMHDESFKQEEAETATREIKHAAELVRSDQINDFRRIISDIKSDNIHIDYKTLANGVPFELMSRYESGNLFDVNVVSIGGDIFIFSYTLGLGHIFSQDRFINFSDDASWANELIAEYIKALKQKKEENKIFVIEEPARKINLPDEYLRTRADLESQLKNVTEKSGGSRFEFVSAVNSLVIFLMGRNIIKEGGGSLLLKDESTASEIVNRLTFLTVLFKKIDRRNLPIDMIATENLLQEKLYAFMATTIYSAIITLAQKAKNENQNLIIGLEMDWIPGYNNEDPLTYNIIGQLIFEIRSIEDRLKAMGIDNVKIVYDKKENLADSVLVKATETDTKLKNVLVIASRDVIESSVFDRLRSTEGDTRAFLAAIDPVQLNEFYINNKFTLQALDIRITEMLSIALEAMVGKELNNIPMVASFDKVNRILILVPKAEPHGYQKMRDKYRAEKIAMQNA